jgi:protein-disulfide isomerase
MRTGNTKRKFVEIGCYLVFASGSAVGMTYLFRPKLPESAQPTVLRSQTDAALLKAALKLEDGKPAVVEFMDFECPPCRSTYPKIKTILKENPQANYRAVNFPLDIHHYAFDAAVAFEIAKKNGQQDEVFDDLFTKSLDLSPKGLNKYLKNRKLPALVGGSEAGAYRDNVDKQRTLGKDLQVSGTPTFFVLSKNGDLTQVRAYGRIAEFLK